MLLVEATIISYCCLSGLVEDSNRRNRPERIVRGSPDPGHTASVHCAAEDERQQDTLLHP